MLSASPPKYRFGFRIFVASCVFTSVTILAVLWDERRQKERRQEGVKYRLNAIKQHSNMEEYELQKQKYQEYKNVNS